MASRQPLSVLLVEDNVVDMTQLQRDLPPEMSGCTIQYDYCNDFDDAFTRVNSRRYDLVLSDTYKGKIVFREAEALKLVNQYRAGRFCPVILFSSGTKPTELTTSAFVRWVGKDKIEKEMKEVLDTGIPQLARNLHDELDQSAGSYLWGFLEDNWPTLNELDGSVLERLIRRRASVQLGN